MARGGSLASPGSPPASAVASAHARIRQEMADFEVERNISTLHSRLSDLYNGDEQDRTPQCLLRLPRSPTASPGPVISRTPSSPGTPSLHSDSARGHTSPDAPTTPATYPPTQSVHEQGSKDELWKAEGKEKPLKLDAIARATQIAPGADATDTIHQATHAARKRKADSLSHESTEQQIATSSKKRKVSSLIPLPHTEYRDNPSPNHTTAISKATLDYLASIFGRRTPITDSDSTPKPHKRRSATRRQARGSRAYDNSISKGSAKQDAKDMDSSTQSQTRRPPRKRRRMLEELGGEGGDTARMSTASSKKRRSAKLAHQSAQRQRITKESMRRVDSSGHRPAAGDWKSRLRPRRGGPTPG